MCGIVVYYGDAQNRLTRILSGMWAIVYRAPDSTGIGLPGSDLEPIKIRRAMGSVENLIDHLMIHPVFEEGDLQAAAFMDDDKGNHAGLVARVQKKLIAYEGFSPKAKASFPTWSQLTDTRAICQVEPGTCGNPWMQNIFIIDSPKALKAAVDCMIRDYDLPAAVVEKLIKKGFQEQVALAEKFSPLPVETSDLLHEFVQIFNRFVYDETPVRPRRVEAGQGPKHPFARKYAWHFLRQVIVTLPADYSTDGIANLFRYLDAWVLAGLTEEAADRIQLIFENFWAAYTDRPARQWQILYRIERTCNFYGLAATAVLAYYQTRVYMKQMPETRAANYFPQGHVPGPTHPLLLKSMVQPVIGQGRWAIQSAISVRNAHPFMDQQKVRAVVLNGQFDSDVESRLKLYITRVAGIGLRTDNSTELFAMLWGHYFDTAWQENQRYKIIEDQHRLELEEMSICSQSIDYTIFKTLSQKNIHDIDEMAFIRAVQAMIPSGGQFAVSGISRVSPDRLFVAAHNRPVYIVKRRETSDFMVVSDINAALGLFPQTLIQSTRIRLMKLMKDYSKKSMIVEPELAGGETRAQDDWFRQEKKALLAPFLVDIYALDQPEIFARIQTKAGKDTVMRHLHFQDFSGKTRTDIRPEQTYITPVSFQKDFGKTFYEEHLLETPGLMKDILHRYTDDGMTQPRFDIRRRLLERRFGSNMANLSRIIFVSTGFSYLLAEIVEKTMEPFFSGINLVVTTPADISHVQTAINPDRDLVVMVSWSGTTSDMIDCAVVLLKHNILMIGITEKPFSDMALVVRKSAGVIPVLSGEEVTVAPLKSAMCMLLILDLLCLHLSGVVTGKTDTGAGLVKEMHTLPELLGALLTDTSVPAFCKNVTKDVHDTVLHYIVDAFHDVGAAKIGALNLELNTWTSMGTAVDYSELDRFLEIPVAKDDFILVLATNRKRMDEAVQFMAALHRNNTPFTAVTYPNREQEVIRELADQVILLPKVSAHFQPFMDLPFMFLLGFYYGLAHGRLAGEMPRNMAKSVTAGRTQNGEDWSFFDILDDMDQKQQALGLGIYPRVHRSGSPCWINLAKETIEKRYFQDLVALGAALHEKDPFSAVFTQTDDTRLEKLSRLIFTHLAEDGMLIFVPMDKQAEAGCRNFARLWEPFLQIPIQVEFAEKVKGINLKDNLLAVVASQKPDEDRLSGVFDIPHDNLFWIGPENDLISRKLSAGPYDGYYVKTPGILCRYEQVYVALSLFFSKVMGFRFPGRAKRFDAHLKLMLPMVQTILEDAALHRQLENAVRENAAYQKQLFLTSMRGNCIIWKSHFRGFTCRGIESDPFGVSAYSHLVMVDYRVDEKYVKLASEKSLKETFGEHLVGKWEARYLGGAGVDDFLSNTSLPFSPDAVPPFFVDSQWYLPVLRPEYDTDQDCLVIVDATSEARFDAALDELATFGSRYARMVVITQKGFSRDARLSNLKKYPLSHIILVPGVAENTGDPGTISDYLLPVAMGLVGAAMKFLDARTGEHEK